MTMHAQSVCDPPVSLSEIKSKEAKYVTLSQTPQS